MAIGKYADIYKNWDAQVGRGLSGSVARSGRAEIINDPERDPRVIDIAGTEEDRATRVILFAPLLIGETVIGVLSVWRDKVVAGPFTQADLDFAVSLARQAAIAIQNARLFEIEHAARAQAETLHAVTQALSRTLGLQDVFDLILTELQKVVPYDSCSVQQLDGDYSVIVGGRGFPNLDELLGMRFQTTAPGDLSAYVINTRQPHIEEDVSARFAHFKDIEDSAGLIHGWLGVPLIFGDRAQFVEAAERVQRRTGDQQYDRDECDDQAGPQFHRRSGFDRFANAVELFLQIRNLFLQRRDSRL